MKYMGQATFRGMQVQRFRGSEVQRFRGSTESPVNVGQLINVIYILFCQESQSAKSMKLSKNLVLKRIMEM